MSIHSLVQSKTSVYDSGLVQFEMSAQVLVQFEMLVHDLDYHNLSSHLLSSPLCYGMSISNTDFQILESNIAIVSSLLGFCGSGGDSGGGGSISGGSCAGSASGGGW
ncbi:hypothetical protein RCL_jg13301.t1 [Rhizophagus clarus]|uniref:Uncharacterized protein n=1 Tax=Rhizophagus clarus TaxID=94130 RepID=A0A8H3LNF5_9GLOM|nr:hypothetical protein RCL_jg13301.t1 [Rhizophagus clarus]